MKVSKFNINEMGSSTIYVLFILALAILLPFQFGPHILNRYKAQKMVTKKSKISIVSDYYLAQMRSPLSALNTRLNNSQFNLKATSYPNPSEVDFSPKDLTVLDSNNQILIPLAGVYIDSNFNTVSNTSPAKQFFIKAFWKIPKIDPTAEQMYNSKTADQLKSHIRAQRILQVFAAGNEDGHDKSLTFEKTLGAESCVVVRGRMLFYNPTTVRYYWGYASCPVGYYHLSGYMTDFEGIANTYRKIELRDSSHATPPPSGVPSTFCESRIDGPWASSPPTRDELGANFVIRTGDGGVDETRSVLPQHWLGKEPYSNEPLNTCYALCCENIEG